ncbi:MAG: J domain-containing protein [Rhodospirillaceae bacterium]|nr:J domain-containing protein [Rhodospirillaceae bacterium]
MRKTRAASPWDDVCPHRPCDHPDCREIGLYPAPKGRDRLREFYWFCLEHVRLYNSSWNYYEGMAEPEIEAHIRHDTVWQRPSWPLGRWGMRRSYRFTLHDGFGPIFGEAAEQGEGGQARGEDGGSWRNGSSARGEEVRVRLAEHERALAVLELKWPVTMEEIKVRYKVLVKKLHPDANGGDKAAEEHLKIVNQAYSTLKNSSLF